MSVLRFLMLLSLVAWIGGLIFFAFVLAPTVFAPGVLPNTHLAGNIVGRALGKLHWIAIPSAIIFLQLLLNDKEMLGEQFANRPWNNFVNWTIIIVLFALSLVLAIQVVAPKLFPAG